MKPNGPAPTDARNQPKPILQGKASDRVMLAGIAHQAMIERGLEPDFPLAAQNELAAISGPGKATDNVRDLRNLLWASIDNDDSRDLDQLTVAGSLAGGQVRILVAVADVGALVHKGSALDGHAARNTTSVYTPAAIFPMLPEVLSTNLTSLNEDQDRLAIVADMVFKEDGSLITSELYRAQVLNRAKLAYNSVAAWLTGTDPAPKRIAEVPGLDENLRLQDLVAQRLVLGLQFGQAGQGPGGFFLRNRRVLPFPMPQIIRAQTQFCGHFFQAFAAGLEKLHSGVFKLIVVLFAFLSIGFHNLFRVAHSRFVIGDSGLAFRPQCYFCDSPPVSIRRATRRKSHPWDHAKNRILASVTRQMDCDPAHWGRAAGRIRAPTTDRPSQPKNGQSQNIPVQLNPPFAGRRE